MNVKSGDRRYTIKCNSAGQPRPYADSVYDFEIIVQMVSYQTGLWQPNDINEELVKDRAKVLGRDWGGGGPFDPELRSMTKIGPGHWRFVVVQPYTD